MRRTAREALATQSRRRPKSAVAIIGTPAVVIELVTPSGAAGGGQARRIQGAGEERRDRLGAEHRSDARSLPRNCAPIRGSGLTEGRIDASGKVTFQVVEELRPGETLTFTIEVDAIQAGDARFRVEVKAAHLKRPLQEEQAARITSK